MSDEFDQKAFDELKQKVHDANMQRLKYYKLFQNYERKHSKLQRELEAMCQHEWKVNRTAFDPCHTCYECKKCGDCR